MSKMRSLIRPFLRSVVLMIALAVGLAVGLAFSQLTPAYAQLDFELPPISYSESQPDNAVSRLIAGIEQGSIRLERDPKTSFLESLLKELDISTTSQMLVFSQTSRQRMHISPSSPRAVYFNDDVYIGWVKDGSEMEISVTDPGLGAVFYSMDLRSSSPEPVIERQFGQCLLCHASTHTQRIPGHMVRSVFTERNGRPIVGSFSYNTTDQSALNKRWGGWYVTGTHGAQRHMGNNWPKEKSHWRELDLDEGANVVDLADRFEVDSYLSPHSDIVALMVLEHQTTMHNIFTSASISWRLHWQEAQEIIKGINEQKNGEKNAPIDRMSSESQAHLNNVARTIVDGLLMKDAVSLTAPIQGTSGFGDEFSSREPTDQAGRGLRNLDLTTRLFRYPCSYTIYSDAFNGLPAAVREAVYRQLWQIFSSGEDMQKYKLKAESSQVIVEILEATKPDLRAFWSELKGETISSE